MKKYEFIESEKTTLDNGTILTRIRALRDFKYVKAGDLGGWLQSEANLDHSGDAWVTDNASVCDIARISGNALISGNAIVAHWARVSDNAHVSSNAWILYNAQISDNVYIYGHTIMSGESQAGGDARIFGNTQVYGNALISGDVHVGGNVRLSTGALIQTQSDYLVVGPLVDKIAYTTFYNARDGVRVVYGMLGEHSVTLEGFLEEIKRQDGADKLVPECELAAKLAKLRIRGE
jgi:carbonic anhydrase/acetyltransferase-like protein (isoleucine patch superfamily)